MDSTESLVYKCLVCGMKCETGEECTLSFLLCAGLLLWIGTLLWFYRSSLDRLRVWFLKQVRDVTTYLRHRLWSLIFLVRPPEREIQEFARLIAHCRIRSKFEFPLFGEDEELDKKIENTVDRFFKEKWWEIDASSEYSEKVLRWLNKDDVSKKDRKMYWRVSRWIAVKTGNIFEVCCVIAFKYRLVYGKKDSLEPIVKRSEIKKTHSEFRKRFRKELDDFWDSRAKAPLFSFSLKEFTLYLPLISVLIIIGAYLHLSFFYAHFNIEVSQFFSLDDYVASSIEEIKYSLFFVGVYFVFWAAVLRGYRSLEISPPTSRPRKLLDWVCGKPQNPTREIQRRYVRREKGFRRGVLGVAYLGCSAFLFYMIFKSGGIPLDGLNVFLFVILLVGVWLVRKSVFWLVRAVSWNKKRFENVFAEIVLLSLVMFFSSMYLAACIQIEKVEKSPTKVYEREKGIEDYSYKGSLIGASNRYIFLRNPDQNTTTIIPQSEAGRIVISTADREPEEKCSSNGSAQNIESCSPCGILGGWSAYFKNRLNCLFCD